MRHHWGLGIGHLHIHGAAITRSSTDDSLVDLQQDLSEADESPEIATGPAGESTAIIVGADAYSSDDPELELSNCDTELCDDSDDSDDVSDGDNIGEEAAEDSTEEDM
jgi:hypothetical protein